MQDRIKNLMGSDPKFITRLISVNDDTKPPLQMAQHSPVVLMSACCSVHLQQLDKQMHQMLKQKQEKQAQIDADMKAIADLDNSIQTHIMVGVLYLTTWI
jgi:hypothetical protein